MKPLNSKKYFRGVYNSFNIPSYIPNRYSQFALILNIGRHYVTLLWTKTSVIYIDSYGTPVESRTVNTYLKKHVGKRTLIVNNQCIQDMESSHCGMFCMLFVTLFIHAMENDRDVGEMLASLNFVSKGDLKKNDKLCIKYIMKMI